MTPSTIHLTSFSLALALLLAGCRTEGNSEKSQHTPKKTSVGSQACASCHAEIYRTYLQTGMGRSFSIADPAKLQLALKTKTSVYEPGSDFHYEVYERGGTIVMREYRVEQGEIMYEQHRVAAYQIGSGNHTISFIEEHNGYLFEMPLTWYSNKKIWDLSPGYIHRNRRFDRPISATCMNCHNSPTVRTPETENHFGEVPFGIGCENCHGAGSEHVALALEGKLSKGSREQAILNPGSFSREVQMDVCQRCHLEGVTVWNDGIEPHEVDIARPLVTFKSVMAVSTSQEHESEFAIAAQAGRLMKSACYRKSGSMTCTTCHNPHRTPDLQGRSSFNATCQSCHHEPALHMLCSVAEGTANKNNCISCHMNTGGTSDIPHVSFTDHYIRRDISNRGSPKVRSMESTSTLIPLLASDNSVERNRSLGIGYFEYFQNEHSDVRYLDSAISHLEAVLRTTPARSDGEDLFVLGNAYFVLQRFQQAESVIRRLLKSAGGHARGYNLLGKTLLASGKIDEAVSAFSDGTRAQPLLVENHLGLAQALFRKGELPGALHHAREAIRLDSLSYPEAYLSLGQIEHSSGNLSEARRHYIEALQRNPDLEGAFLNIGASLLTEQHWQDALPFFEQILNRNPDNLPALHNRLMCLVNLGKTREAREVAQHLLHLQPDNKEIRTLLAELPR
ncbi:MAG: tetratricopeptide repeat protein [Ignavibacteriales bacterium]|nr:tetratricopeptide repeat protein [Ignavibacteriales bacterium]